MRKKTQPIIARSGKYLEPGEQKTVSSDDWKKNAQYKRSRLSIQCLIEDYSPGDNLPDGYEELLWRGRGRG